MKRNIQVLLLLLSGAGVLHITLLTEVYLRYVKEGLRIPLIVSGVLLLALGMVGAARDGFPFAKPTAEEPAEHADHDGDHGGGGHGHGHSSGPRIAWLLFLPALALLFFTPPALGAFTAARESDPAVSEDARFAPLPDRSPLVMPLSDFQARARQDTGRSLKGRTVRMTGFVTPGEDGGWYLTRLVLSCCAADAQSVKVRMHGAEAPQANSWVTVTGSWRPVGEVGTDSARAALDVAGMRRVPQPANPYADAVPPTA
ncbi:TIGR03943 family putative permease subunit [Streptomyces pathocidini]|uniref:TIGR03943 family putative permease subunit n=1 Tax=Streptomyces pathocidini TaxID=1650571 RepID=A0ABW7UUD2_9ACTN|nr:TIGR03943 family protein [Streptomyces pathocidini]